MDLPKGFSKDPKKNPNGSNYVGRFTCSDVQWIGKGKDAFCTFTATAGQIADAALSNILWTDQAVQRGIKPGSDKNIPKELSLANGYPDGRYVFDANNSDEMAQKLLKGERLFLSPLIWNLRPSTFEAYFEESSSDVNIYSGRVYLPDSHHRHQAIVKAVSAFRDAPGDYLNFSDLKEFKIELYFLSREDEGNYFFDKNQRPKPIAQSKAFDLSTEDDLSVLAKRVITESASLKGNVNRVTDRLSRKDPDVVTLSTLREAMKTISSTTSIDADELEGLAISIARAFDLIASVRPELTILPLQQRIKIRDELIVDASTTFHGYAGIIKDFINLIPKFGFSEAEILWKEKLTRLSAKKVYEYKEWKGDIFEKSNPVWKEVGVLRRSSRGDGVSLVNTRESRAASADVLRRVINMEHDFYDLKEIVGE